MVRRRIVLERFLYPRATGTQDRVACDRSRYASVARFARWRSRVTALNKARPRARGEDRVRDHALWRTKCRYYFLRRNDGRGGRKPKTLPHIEGHLRSPLADASVSGVNKKAQIYCASG